MHDVDTWDVFRSAHRAQLGFVYGRLGQMDPGPPECALTPVPELAQGWQWLDDRTLEVKLRPGVKWQNISPVNGRQVVANDVVYSVQLWPKAAFLAQQLKKVEEVVATDDHTVRFVLKQPFSGFVGVVISGEFAFVVAPEVWGEAQEVTLPEQTVGTGPFQLLRYTPGVATELERNPTYWRQGLPLLDGIKILVMPDQSTVVSALRAGRIDVAEFRAAAAVQQLETTAPHLKFHPCLYPASVVLSMRTDKAPYNDVRVRRAISMAIDQQALVESVYLGKAMAVPTQVVPVYKPYYVPLEEFPPEIRRYAEYHPDEAKKLLAEAGYPNGFSATLVATARYVDQKQMAEAIVDMLSKVGIKVELEIWDWGLFAKKILLGGGQMEHMAVNFLSGADLDVHSKVYDSYVPGAARNRSHVDDPELLRLGTEQMVATDIEKRKEIIRKIQFRQLEMSYYIMLPTAQQVMVTQPYVKGLYFKPSGKLYGDYLYQVWLDR